MKTSTLIFQLLVVDAEQLNLENQGSVFRNNRRISPLPIPIITRNTLNTYRTLMDFKTTYGVIINRDFSPRLNWGTPSSHPLITLPTPMTVSNAVPIHGFNKCKA